MLDCDQGRKICPNSSSLLLLIYIIYGISVSSFGDFGRNLKSSEKRTLFELFPRPNRTF